MHVIVSGSDAPVVLLAGIAALILLALLIKLQRMNYKG